MYLDNLENIIKKNMVKKGTVSGIQITLQSKITMPDLQQYINNSTLTGTVN